MRLICLVPAVVLVAAVFGLPVDPNRGKAEDVNPSELNGQSTTGAKGLNGVRPSSNGNGKVHGNGNGNGHGKVLLDGKQLLKPSAKAVGGADNGKVPADRLETVILDEEAWSNWLFNECIKNYLQLRKEARATFREQKRLLPKALYKNQDMVVARELGKVDFCSEEAKHLSGVLPPVAAKESSKKKTRAAVLREAAPRRLPASAKANPTTERVDAGATVVRAPRPANNIAPLRRGGWQNAFRGWNGQLLRAGAAARRIVVPVEREVGGWAAVERGI
ncbi:MAG: hypothetical protein M1826_000864 [Phylliscum demangeonii]|nr:MAG: hypothetical protein M1826_000864 [Phylliscum demangeonii]